MPAAPTDELRRALLVWEVEGEVEADVLVLVVDPVPVLVTVLLTEVALPVTEVVTAAEVELNIGLFSIQ